MLTDELKKKLHTAEREFKSGKRELQRKWKAFDPRTNREVVDGHSIQRSVLLSYCGIVGKELTFDGRLLEVGVEKHRHVCTQLGVKGDWERLDRMQDCGGNVTNYLFDFVDDGVPDELLGVFDTVICSNVLEHTYDIFTGFDRIFSMAKPSGLLYFSTPFSIHVHGEEDYWRLTPQVYERLMPKYSDDFIILEESFNKTLHGVSCFVVKK